jgi:hypothetical protein
MTDFGYSTIGTASTDDPSNNWIWCKATSTPASNGTLTAITCHCAIASGTPTICMALYTDSAGAPGSLIVANETGVTVAAGFAWVSQTFSQAITSGTQYWFGIRVPAATASGFDINVKFDTNGSAIEGWNKGAADANFPASVSGASSFANERWSIYGTYTPSGAASYLSPRDPIYVQRRL